MAKKMKAAASELKIELGRKDVEKVKGKWEWPDDSVDEINAIHIVEYLTPDERIHFVNEAHRVLKIDSKLSIITPYWAANRAFGDLATQWPPVAESWYPHLNKKWREEHNPFEKRYTCDFQPTWGYGMHQTIVTRNQDYQQHAIMYWKEAAQDLIATLVKV